MIIVFALLLCGCNAINKADTELDKLFADDKYVKVRANNYSDYIEYYLPSDVNEDNCSKLAYSFSDDDYKFILNINVSGIINSQYYKDYKLVDEGFFDDNKLIYKYEGDYVNSSNNKNKFFVKVYEYDNQYILHFVTSTVNVYGTCKQDKLYLLASKVLQIVKSVNIYEDKIITDYSSKDVIDYNKSVVNLFEDVFPIEGKVEDMMIEKSPIGNVSD